MKNLRNSCLLLLAAGCFIATSCVAPKAPPRPPRPPKPPRPPHPAMIHPPAPVQADYVYVA